MDIIATVGPKTLNAESLIALVQAGATDLRINLSHSNKELLSKYIKVFKDSGLKPSLDTQGAQLRTVKSSDRSFHQGEELEILFNQYSPSSSEKWISLNHIGISDQLQAGDLIRIDIYGLVVKVLSLRPECDSINTVVIASGRCQENRAVDVLNKIVCLNHITDFDRYAIDLIKEIDSPCIYYSFANDSAGVNELRSLIPSNTKLISKIESRRGLCNLPEIAMASDAVLIDRGDLSREISISMIPLATDSVLKTCIDMQVPVFVATNVLELMMDNPLPSRAEISDIWGLLQKGVSGIVLAAEVAIGSNPIDSTYVVSHMAKLHKLYKTGCLFAYKKHDFLASSDISEELRQWL